MGDGWKVVHKKFCELGTPSAEDPFAWPLRETAKQRSCLSFGGMTYRQHEVVVIIDRYFPPLAEFEFFDLNADFGWTLKAFIQEDPGGRPKWKENALKSSPWHACPQTDAGSTTLCFRFSPNLETKAVRLLDPHEEFRLQGWDIAEWRVPVFPAHVSMEFEQLDLLSDLAGSFCCCVYCSCRVL